CRQAHHLAAWSTTMTAASGASTSSHRLNLSLLFTSHTVGAGVMARARPWVAVIRYRVSSSSTSPATPRLPFNAVADSSVRDHQPLARPPARPVRLGPGPGIKLAG